jgi:ATP-dependent Clp protease ATP-binding subunit ClpB
MPLLNKCTENVVIADEIVDEDEISEVIAKWTNIPVSKLKTSERAKLLSLNKNIKERVIDKMKL